MRRIVFVLAFAACGHARHPFPTTGGALQLSKVVLYRNGVGYFERSGKVDGDALTIRVRKDQVNDLLKSLTVVERRGGRAVSISMPLDPRAWVNAASAPLWKPTYRVVLPEGGKGQALLQGWAVVDNTTGEDWRDVKLALTAGAPIAFRYDLHTPREVARADLSAVGTQKHAQVSVGET